jgi:acetyltransferase-like isoleucine patch superfamily enzyme
MFRELIFKCVDKFAYHYQLYQVERLKKSLAFCGDRVRISPHTVIWGNEGVSLGDEVEINNFTHIFGAGGVEIGARALISACVSISSLTHEEPIGRRNNLIKSRVTIEEDCWLGTGSIVLPGVRIGRGSIIGAGAVVSREIPPYSVAIGVPARVVRQIKS